MRHLFLDIEAVRNALDWTPPADKPTKLAPAPCWEIVCVGLMAVDINLEMAPTAGVKLQTFSASDALKVLKGSPIVTFNGRTFDLPILEWHAIKNGLPVPRLFQKFTRGRYDEGHLDLLDWITNYGSTDRVSLDLACRAVGLVGKGEHSGADVAAMVDEGRIKEIKTYCLSDVAQLGVLWSAVSLSTGWLTPALAVLVEAAIWEAVDAVPGLAWMTDCPRRTH